MFKGLMKVWFLLQSAEAVSDNSSRLKGLYIPHVFKDFCKIFICYYFNYYVLPLSPLVLDFTPPPIICRWRLWLQQYFIVFKLNNGRLNALFLNIHFKALF